MLKLDKGRHELACTNCGAPLRHMKMLSTAAPARAAVTHQAQVRQFAVSAKVKKSKPVKRSKPKKRKKWFKDWAEDVFDLVEDILD